MANKRITELTAIDGDDVANDDLLMIVDVSDPTMAATGTNKKITVAEFATDSTLGGAFVAKSTLTTDGDVLTRAAGVPARITRADLAQDTAFSSRYAPVNGAWTAWTPTVTSGSGTLTTASASSCSYLKTGSLFFARGVVIITTAGTGAGTIDVTMPSGISWPSGAAFWVGGWFENTTATSGQILTNNVGAFALLKDDGTTAINDNRSFRFHIFGQV